MKKVQTTDQEPTQENAVQVDRPAVMSCDQYTPGEPRTLEEALENMYEKWGPAFKALSK